MQPFFTMRKGQSFAVYRHTVKSHALCFHKPSDKGKLATVQAADLANP